MIFLLTGPVFLLRELNELSANLKDRVDLIELSWFFQADSDEHFLMNEYLNDEFLRLINRYPTWVLFKYLNKLYIKFNHSSFFKHDNNF